MNEIQLTLIPSNDRQMVRCLGPLDILGLLLQLLHLHRELSLLNLVVRERLELRGETEVRRNEDEPLGGVVLVPLGRVPEIARELVVEVVVTFAEGDESSDNVIP